MGFRAIDSAAGRRETNGQQLPLVKVLAGSVPHSIHVISATYDYCKALVSSFVKMAIQS